MKTDNAAAKQVGGRETWMPGRWTVARRGLMTLVALLVSLLMVGPGASYAAACPPYGIADEPVPVHTYTFTVDGEEVATQAVADGENLLNPITPADPTGKDRAFAGWFVVKKDSEDVNPATKMVWDEDGTQAADEVVTESIDYQVQARFKNTHFVRLYWQGQLVGVQTVEDGAQASKSDADAAVGGVTVTADGPEVVGWSTEPEPTSDSSEFSFATPITADTSLYAMLKPAVEVTFDTQGGSIVTKRLVPQGQTLDDTALQVPQNPERFDGWNFAGWMLEEDQDAAVAYLPDGSSATDGEPALNALVINANMNFYAKWVPTTDPVDYRVSYLKQTPDGSGFEYAFSERKTGQAFENPVLTPTTAQACPTVEEERDDKAIVPATCFDERFELAGGDGQPTYANAVNGNQINPDGQTIVTVRYVRKTYTLTLDNAYVPGSSDHGAEFGAQYGHDPDVRVEDEDIAIIMRYGERMSKAQDILSTLYEEGYSWAPSTNEQNTIPPVMPAEDTTMAVRFYDSNMSWYRQRFVGVYPDPTGTFVDTERTLGVAGATYSTKEIPSFYADPDNPGAGWPRFPIYWNNTKLYLTSTDIQPIEGYKPTPVFTRLDDRGTVALPRASKIEKEFLGSAWNNSKRHIEYTETLDGVRNHQVAIYYTPLPFTVFFDLEGGQASGQDRVVASGEHTTDSSLENVLSDKELTSLPREGQTRNFGGATRRFDGWYTSEEFTDPVDFSQLSMPGHDLYVFAKWTAVDPTITFHNTAVTGEDGRIQFDDDDTAVVGSQVVARDDDGVPQAGDKNKTPEIALLTPPAGYTADDFLEWGLLVENAKYGGKFLRAYDWETTVDRDIHLYPVWKPLDPDGDPVEVTYHVGEGTGDAPEVQETVRRGYVIVSQPTDITPPAGRHFLYWKTADGTMIYPNQALKLTQDTLELTAVYSLDPLPGTTLHLYSNYFEGTTEPAVTHDQALTHLEIFTLKEPSEYSIPAPADGQDLEGRPRSAQFLGWNTQADWLDAGGASSKGTVFEPSTVAGAREAQIQLCAPAATLYAMWNRHPSGTAEHVTIRLGTEPFDVITGEGAHDGDPVPIIVSDPEQGEMNVEESKTPGQPSTVYVVSADIDRFTPGDYTVTYQVTDAFGASSEFTRTVTVTPTLIPTGIDLTWRQWQLLGATLLVSIVVAGCWLVSRRMRYGSSQNAMPQHQRYRLH